VASTIPDPILPRWHRLLPEPGAPRVLAASTLVNRFGTGLFFTVSAIYFTRSVGLSPAQLAAALTIAALVRLVVSAPLGHLADRLGPREVMTVAACLEGLVVACLVLVHDLPGLVVVLALQALTDAASYGARGALVANAVPPEARVRTQAYLRSATNLGFTFGAAGAGVALHLDTATAYQAMILVDAVTYVLAGLVVLRMAHVAPVPATRTGPRLVALRDRPFLAVTALNGILCIHYGMLEVAVPLWTVQHTEAPRWIVSVVLMVNTVAVVLFQVRTSRHVRTVADAARVQRRGGLVIAVACVVYALAAGHGAWVAAGMLVVGAAVHVAGELFQAAGSYGLGFGLAPAHAQGQYQSVFGMGESFASLVGPALTTALAVGGGLPGWVALGLMFAAAGAVMPRLAGWAERSRTVTSS
jgi:MFS family permease